MPKPSAKRVIITSTIVDVIDVTMNATVAIITGSVVMLAETLQGVADLLIDIFLIVGYKRSHKPPDTKHPFGYGRELYFWTLLASIAMFTLTGGFSIYFGWHQLINPQPIEAIWIAFIVLTISLFTNIYSCALGAKRLLNGRSIKRIFYAFNHSAYIETKTTFTADLIGTVAAIIGIFSLAIYQFSGYGFFDGLGGMLIGITISGFSILLVSSIKSLLIGQTVPPHIKRQIKQAALEINQVNQVLDLTTVIIGSDKILVNLEVHAKQHLTTKQLEKVIDDIKANVVKKVPITHHIQVELETP